jgi:uncharacterized protein with HEPN domain
MKVDRPAIVYIDHVLECIAKVEKYINGYTKDQFIGDSKTYDAVIRNLQIMAESTQKLPKKLKDSFGVIQWGQIVGFRNILVHDYLEGVDYENVWSTIQYDLPDLKNIVTQMKEDIDHLELAE